MSSVLVVEKLMDVEAVASPKQIVLVGPVQKTVFQYPATSASNNNIIFNNICAPSLTTVMRRCIRVAMEAQVVISSTGSGAGGIGDGTCVFNAVSVLSQAGAFNMPTLVAGRKVNWSVGGADVMVGVTPGVCLRAMPLSSVISSADIRINGGSTNVALDEFKSIYPQLINRADIRQFGSECPLFPDNSGLYEKASHTSPFADVLGNDEQARGAFTAYLLTLTQTDLNSPMIATYSLRWTEELMLSPFVIGRDQDDVGMVNVNNLTISLRLNDLQQMLSAVPKKLAATPASTFVVTIAGAAPPVLLVEFDSQNSILAQRSPQMAVYPYKQLQTYQRLTAIVPASFGAVSETKQTLSLDSLRLPCQPAKIYLFIAPTYSARTPFISDHFLRITNISVNFNDKSALLNGLDESSLYELSALNQKGAFPSFNQWRYGVGSIVCLDVQRDLSVAESSASGTQNQFSTLQITVKFTNSNVCYAGVNTSGTSEYADALPASYTAYQLVESPGLLYLSASQGEFVVEGPSPAEVLALTASGDAKVPEDILDPTGAGFSNLLSLAWKHRSGIADVAKAAHSAYTSGGAVSAGAMGHRRA